MLTLAFDTANNLLSCALLSDEKILDKNTIFESGKQSELLVLEIENILRRNGIWYGDLDLVATTSGPGSFTGVRVGLAVARTIRIAINKPLLLINSCEVIAYKYKSLHSKIVVALDARMYEAFVAEFLSDGKNLQTIKEPYLVKVEELDNFSPQEKFFRCGSFFNANDVIEADLVGLLAIEKFKQGLVNDELDPLYLRMPRIEKRKK